MKILAFIAAMLVCSQAVAASSQRCAMLPVELGGADFSLVSLASGAVSADEIRVDSFKYAVLHLDLVDADSGITNIKFTYTITDTAGGQARIFPDCSAVSPSVTCNGQVEVNHDPKKHGKNWVIPFPTMFEFVTATFTPTGHGSGDSITATLRACYD